MLNIQGYLDLLNDRSYKPPPFINRWRQVYYGMSIHIDGVLPRYKCLSSEGVYINYEPPGFYGVWYQDIFDYILFSKHPREPEGTRQWRYSQYKPFQKDPFLRVIQTITGAIFQDAGYGITIDDAEDNDYIWGNNFEGKDLPGYLVSKAKNIFEDPNGVFITIPEQAYYETSTPRIEPKIYFVPSKDIIWHNKDEIVFNLNGYAWAVNGLVYLRYEKGDDEQYTHVDEKYGGYYAHLTGKCPILVAGGIWNTQGHYDSWLDAAKAWADEFVGSKSAEQLINKEACHPFLIAANDECPDCTSGQVPYCGVCNHSVSECSCAEGNVYTNNRMLTCRSCGGTGVQSRTPGQWMLANKEDMKEAGKLIQVINFDVAANKHLYETNAALYINIMEALHLYSTRDAQSAVAKDKDMETRYQFILSISNDWFDRLITGWITQILSLRNVSTSNGVTKPNPGEFQITKPTQFAIKTAQDLLDELEASAKANIPDDIRKMQLEAYVDKQYGGNEVVKRKTGIINTLDSQAVALAADIAIKVLNNAISNRDWQFHEALPGILDEIIRENGKEWFCKAEFDKIENMVELKFNELKPIIPTITDPTIIRGNV